MRRVAVGLFLCLGLAFAFTLASAHDLFIKMDSYFLPPDTPVEIPIINGTFELSENSITGDRVSDISLIRDGARKKLNLDGWKADRDTTFYSMRTGEPGTYVFGVSTLTRDLGMDAPDFNEYLAHDGVVDVLAQRALDRELDVGVWERYSKHVKAVFQVGDRRTGGLDVVLGYPAELLPLTNPYELSVGDEMAVRAMVYGQSVSRQLVLAGGSGANGPIAEREARTDTEGVVRFRIEAPGRWYIKFINMEKTNAEGVDYESQWATLSFEVH